MIDISEVIKIQKLLIEQFGGSHGLRDMQSLESAITRPFQMFEGQSLYPTILEKAAALVESLLVNHPFIDGNKRIGYTVLRVFLNLHGINISASMDNRYEFIIDIASGAKKYEEIVLWLQRNTEG